MNFAIYKTELGNIKIGFTLNEVTEIKFVNDIKDCGAKTEFSDFVFNQLQEYFLGKRKYFDFKTKLVGTKFQISVWNKLTEIEYGKTKTYKQIAEEIGNPNASRAVGNANNKNPILVVVPCHRVVGATGDLVGYAGGLSIKQQLLNLEQNKG